MQKLKLKSIYMLCRKCSSSDTEHNKIGLAFFGFFCNLICILQLAAETQQRVKKHFARRPLELLNLTELSSVFNTQVPTNTKMQHRGPDGVGELAASEGSPELGIKPH
jgi:hypothetical protein